MDIPAPPPGPPSAPAFSPPSALPPGTLAADGIHGLVQTYILESPVLGALACLLVGILVAEALRRAGKGRPALVAFALAVVAGAAIIFVGAAVETPRERVSKHTTAFVSAVVAADPAAVASALAPKVAFRTDGRVELQLDRDWLVSVTRGLGGVFKSHSLEMRDVTLSNNDTIAQARFLSRATFTNEIISFVPSTWELTWRLDTRDAEWKLHAVECLTLYGKPASSEWINWGNRHRK